MAKKRDILLTVLFCGFIGAMAVLTAFLPKQEVSVNEKRTLAKFPEFSVQKLFNGKWEKDFETYQNSNDLKTKIDLGIELGRAFNHSGQTVRTLELYDILLSHESEISDPYVFIMIREIF